MHRALLTRVLLAVLATAVTPWPASAQAITGVVRDAQSGNGLSSMVASAYTPDPSCSTRRVVCWKNAANETTDASGRYTLNVAPGSYRVLAFDPTGVRATQFNGGAESFDVTPVTTLSAGQIASVDFHLVAGGSISGTAVTSGGVKAGIVVAAFNLSGTRRGFAMTGADGSYSFVVPPGSYKVLAYDEAGTFATAFYRDRADFAGADAVPVLAGRASSGTDLFLSIGARFSGTATTSAGIPVDGATIYAYDSKGTQVASAFSGADGRYSITLPGGAYRFVAVDESRVYAPAFASGAISFDTSPVVSLLGGQSKSGIDFRMELAGSLKGLVTDARSGSGLPAMTVAAYNADGSLRQTATTGAAGAYDLLLPSATFTLAAWDSNLVFAPQFYPLRDAYRFASPVTISPSTSTTLQPFSLRHAGRFSGVVTNKSGEPVAGAVVAAYDQDGYSAATATTNATGQYRLGVVAGGYRLIAYDPQLRYAVSFGSASSFDGAATRVIAADADISLNFSLSSGAHVSGRVADSVNRPVVGAEVTAYDLQGNRVGSAPTDANGSFELVLIPGSYKFGSRDPGGRYAPAFFGGSSFSGAVVVAVTSAGAPSIDISLHIPSRRRAVKH